jgi:SOS response regulatory protein OraA/RecX
MTDRELVDKLKRYKKEELIDAFIEYMYSVNALGDKEDEEQYIYDTIKSIINSMK